MRTINKFILFLIVVIQFGCAGSPAATSSAAGQFEKIRAQNRSGLLKLSKKGTESDGSPQIYPANPDV